METTNDIGVVNFNGCTTNINTYSLPKRVDVIEYPDKIEMVYTEQSMISHWPDDGFQRRVFKIVYSCIDGKWNKSDRIYGEIIPAQEETYTFE